MSENKTYRKIERLSPSSINKLLTDYRGWYKNYVLGESIPNNIYFEFGTAFHGLLEDFMQGELQEGETISGYAERMYNAGFDKWFVNNKTIQPFWDEELGITQTAAEEWTFKYINKWVGYATVTEKKKGTAAALKENTPKLCEWHLEDEELKVHGYADAYYGKYRWTPASGFLNFHNVDDEVNPNIMRDLMVDYKTSKVDLNTNNTTYYLQAMIYALIFQRAHKRNKLNFVCIDYIKYNEKYFYQVTPEALAKIEKLIKEAWNVVDMINDNPEKYADKPPMKLRLGDYI